MAIVSSNEITLTRVDDGQDGADGTDGYSPQVTITPHQSVPAAADDVDIIDINVTMKDASTGTVTTTTTPIKKADRIYEGLVNLSVFNQLTNGGQLQGLFVSEDNHAYFNGTYLRAEGADIAGFHIEDKMMWAYADHEYEYTDPEDSSSTIIEVSPRFTVINSKAEFYDAYDAEHVNEYYGSLFEDISPATPAFAAGIDGILEVDGETSKYVMSDINTARVKVMHDGSIYAGRFEADNDLGYDYNFKVDDEQMLIGKGGHYLSVRSLDEDYPQYGSGIALTTKEMMAIFSVENVEVGGYYRQSGKEVYLMCGSINADFVTYNETSQVSSSGRFSATPSGISVGTQNGMAGLGSSESRYGVSNIGVNLNPFTDNRVVLTGYGGDVNGISVAICGGATTVIGSGEAGYNIVNNNVNNTKAGTDENLHLASDYNIYFYSNCQTIANRKQMTFDANGHLNLPGLANINGYDMFPTWQSLTKNSTYVTSGQAWYYRTGKIIVLYFADVTFSTTAHSGSNSTNHVAFSGLPATDGPYTFVLTPYGGNYYGMRLQARADGKIYFHYTTNPNANYQYYGFAVIGRDYV